MRSSFLPNYQPKTLSISALEVYYCKVSAKRESIFFLQEDGLSFVLTLKYRAEILKIFGWHFWRDDDLINSF